MVLLKAGAAKRIITPTTSLPMTRRSGRLLPDPAKTYHPLYARVLVLNDGEKRFVIITHELSSLTYTAGLLRERCQRELGIDPAYLAPIATHNHQAPLMRLDANRPYGEWLADTIFDLIEEAIRREQPARLFFGRGQTGFARNQEWRAPADHEVQLLEVESAGRPFALLFNYASHPSGWPVAAYGPDYAGFATTAIEQEMPGTVAMFGQACGADQFFITPKGCDDPLEAIQLRGNELAGEVLRISHGPTQEITGPIESRLEILDLPLASPISEQEAERRAEVENHPRWIDTVLEHYRTGAPFPTTWQEEVIVARLGPLAFIAMQGEVCSPIGMRIKDILGEAMPAMVFAYMGEREIYIPSREIIRVDSYQASVVQDMGGSPCAWAPEVEDATVMAVVGKVIPPEELQEMEARGIAA